jgi:mRNA-degrading endonuclease RelE of RelBE toxin-antitoxin system
MHEGHPVLSRLPPSSEAQAERTPRGELEGSPFSARRGDFRVIYEIDDVANVS